MNRGSQTLLFEYFQSSEEAARVTVHLRIDRLRWLNLNESDVGKA